MLNGKLYLATVSRGAAALAAQRGLGLELDDFCTASDLGGPGFAGRCRAMEAEMEGTPRQILHAPFAELSPAAIDPEIGRVSRQRYEQAYRLAASHGIRRMVVHSGFIPNVYHPDWFVGRAAAFWRDFLADKPDDFELLVENVFDPDPGPLTGIIKGAGDGRLRLCMDIGHAAVCSRRPWTDWLGEAGPMIAHFHLHNNDGRSDLHAGLADGRTDMAAFLAAAVRRCPSATFTLETAEAEPSLRWLGEQGFLGGSAGR